MTKLVQNPFDINPEKIINMSNRTQHINQEQVLSESLKLLP